MNHHINLLFWRCDQHKSGLISQLFIGRQCKVSTHTLHSVFSFVLLHCLLHTFPQVVFPFSKDENLGYLDFKLVQKNNTDNELFLSKYMVGHLFGCNDISESSPDYNQIPIIWTKLSKLSFRAPLKCLEPEFHIHKKQPFNRVASKMCWKSNFTKRSKSPKIFPILSLGPPLSKLPSAGGKEPKYET